MNSAEIRSDLLKKIGTMSVAQLKEFYSVVQNYFNSNEIAEGCIKMTVSQKEKIEKGIVQADAGNTKPLSEITNRLRQKHRLNA